MFLLVCVVLICFPAECAEGAREGIKTALEVVIPSILPFLIFAQGMIYTGKSKKISEKCAPLFKLLHLNPNGALPFLSSLLAGYPTGCKVVCEMYKQGIITKDEAEELLCYTNNGGVVFAVNVCGIGAFNSARNGWIVFFVQIVSAIVTGMILSKSGKGEIHIQKIKKASFAEALGKSIASAGVALVNIISAFVVFYALIAALKIEKYPLLCGMCEITKGIVLAGEKGNLPLAAMLFSFGGLSVFAQTASFAAEGELSLKKFFVGKVLSALFAFLITYLYIKITYATA